MIDVINLLENIIDSMVVTISVFLAVATIRVDKLLTECF